MNDVAQEIFRDQVRLAFILTAIVNLLCVFGSSLLAIAASSWIRSKTRANWQYFVLMLAMIIIMVDVSTYVANTMIDRSDAIIHYSNRLLK